VFSQFEQNAVLIDLHGAQKHEGKDTLKDNDVLQGTDSHPLLLLASPVILKEHTLQTL